MAEIRPFRALRYADDADLSAVTCPPYDVLSPQARQQLFDRSPSAAARLILPEGDADAKYENAALLLRQWQESGVLREDETPGFYVTRTEFTEPGSASGMRGDRLGLMALTRLQPYADRVVLPHERTLTGPKEDRRKLLRATNTNVESIMLLVPDDERTLYRLLKTVTEKNPPLADFAGDDEQTHQLWKVEDPQTIRQFQEMVEAQPVYIADGHHRYETSLAHAQETNALGTEQPEAFLLTTLLSESDPGIALLPTHRLVRDTDPDKMASLFQHLQQHFDIQQLDRADVEERLRLAVENQITFGLVMHSGNLFLVTARDASALETAMPADLDSSLKRLPVTVLQHLVLDEALGIPADQVATTDRLAYTRDVGEAIERVENEEFDLALLLGRMPVGQMRDVSLAGEVMPQKSTFFYPKLVSGLVMRRMA